MATQKYPASAVHYVARSFFYVGSRLLNPLIVKLAGSHALPVLAVIQHRGRRYASEM